MFIQAALLRPSAPHISHCHWRGSDFPFATFKFQKQPSHFSLGRGKPLKQAVPLLLCLWIIPLPDGMSVLQQGSLDWICIVCVYIWFLALDGLFHSQGV